MQPLFISKISSSALTMRSLSMPISPNFGRPDELQLGPGQPVLPV
jgi:hypothetical protein